MKIRYEFATETVEIEVDDNWGSLVVDLDRQEYNNNHTETRRHYSLDALIYEGESYGAEDPSIQRLVENQDLHEAIASLTPNQQQIIVDHFFYGLTYTEIAQRTGKTVQAVNNAAERAKKQIKKIISEPR